MGGSVTIYVQVYLPYRGLRRWAGEVEVPEGTQAGGLLPLLGLVEPELAVLVNSRWVDPALLLAAGDRVAILRQADGG